MKRERGTVEQPGADSATHGWQMSNRPFYIVDVFAEDKYAGNQLAVVRDAGGLDGEEMQRIALEMNYAETSFVTSERERDGGFDVRIFTPRTEVPFAGHPTLGTAFVIRQEIVKEPLEKVALNLKVGQIPVTFQRDDDGRDVLWMHQQPPEFGETVEPEIMAPVLGVGPEAIDTRFPIQQVSTGLAFVIVPMKRLEDVRRCRINRDAYDDLVRRRDMKSIFFFCPETYADENQINARMFADAFGVPEDPATGSANGCLAGYLVHHGYYGSDEIEVRVEQGYEIGRPSLLRLKAARRDDTIEVFVGGRVVLVARGELV